MSEQIPLIVLVGPTGAGKTALAVRLCRALDGEIVSADSRQIYRCMDIGTAKPAPEELAAVPHHLVDIRDPDEDFSLAEYQALAYAAIDDVARRGRLPFLVGGTGQYVQAVIEGWSIPHVPADPALRALLYTLAESEGQEALHARLQALDPQAAAQIDPRNVRRVVRALEVCIKTGQPFSAQRGKSPPPYDVLLFGLTMAREALYERIDARIDHMVEAGLIDEVRRLLALSYGWDLPAMSSLGYLQWQGYFEGRLSLDEAVVSIKKETRRFIRHQYNWFRPGDRRIHWLDATGAPDAEALETIRARFGPRLSPSDRGTEGAEI